MRMRVSEIANEKPRMRKIFCARSVQRLVKKCRGSARTYVSSATHSQRRNEYRPSEKMDARQVKAVDGFFFAVFDDRFDSVFDVLEFRFDSVLEFRFDSVLEFRFDSVFDGRFTSTFSVGVETASVLFASAVFFVSEVSGSDIKNRARGWER
jgi:hypothetical protein